ncbi:branched-chain amino acid ABC transporter permease [Rubeoparvulum massiliense]|uniref:branched-chain amino acid ABC transporter permease n=1 Tax=Rubeoparvulum massiliense TaxID=1631346 RepID=UPI00065E5D20|nr:branched-chain amino acid ABC transporter permease [Rubeoparvulum massiliense]
MTFWELWISLSINGFALGMLIFLLAVGLTLIFGLMHVLNFAHGGLFAFGAFSGIWVYQYAMQSWGFSDQLGFLVGLLGAIFSGVILGFIIEKLIIQPVYGDLIAQILITLGAMIVLTEVTKLIFGVNPVGVQPPAWLAGNIQMGEITIIKYRIFLIMAGLLIFALMQYLLNRTRLGLIVRAGVEDKEMVQAFGINIKNIFLGVFILGAVLASIGGFLVAPYQQVITSGIGMEYQLLAFVVVVIGGMGSVPGSMVAAILVGIATAFINYYAAGLSTAIVYIIMVLVLFLRPQGLFGGRE